MAIFKEPEAMIENRLLAKIPKKEYKQLAPDLEQVTLSLAEVLYKPGDSFRHVYFPNTAIVSLLSTPVEGSADLGVSVVGNEGMVGLSVFLGVKTSLNRVIVQGEGTAIRMKASALQRHFNHGGPLQHALQRYTHALLTQISQTVACTRFHLIEERLLCWLLMTHDRMLSDEIRIKHEFISSLLGVRREAITRALSDMQKKKLISYSREKITILDRTELEVAACKCYGIVKKEYDQYLGL
ncbi:MAG TPA: Crp/Fnr family transcriptional regulator [Blastocatellia bacterium]|nr:Crp/Fnr family transcriptional regulator [Blastocatellia bacterium]